MWTFSESTFLHLNKGKELELSLFRGYTGSAAWDQIALCGPWTNISSTRSSRSEQTLIKTDVKSSCFPFYVALFVLTMRTLSEWLRSGIGIKAPITFTPRPLIISFRHVVRIIVCFYHISRTVLNHPLVHFVCTEVTTVTWASRFRGVWLEVVWLPLPCINGHLHNVEPFSSWHVIPWSLHVFNNANPCSGRKWLHVAWWCDRDSKMYPLIVT